MMTVFEPLFILCFLATVIVLVLVAVAAIRGKRAEALGNGENEWFHGPPVVRLEEPSL